MILSWHKDAWEQYIYWSETNTKITKNINKLIKEIMRDPFKGIGKPEPLKNQWQGFWSRRITVTHRLVYKVENNKLFIAQCRFHY